MATKSFDVMYGASMKLYFDVVVVEGGGESSGLAAVIAKLQFFPGSLKTQVLH